MTPDYSSVADDVEWLRNEWWHPGNDPSEGHIRRGSATIDLLLRQGLLGRAWRHFGFSGGEPTINAPDVLAFLTRFGLQVKSTGSLLAGGGRLGELQIAFLGVFKVDHPETGVSAEADSGFAVQQTCVVRDARQQTPGDLDDLVNRQWKLTEYLRSPATIRRGVVTTRADIIDYFRNYVGGAHCDVLTNARNSKTNQHEMIQEMSGKLLADVREGLHFELLSVGQAIAASQDVAQLVRAIRAGGRDASTPPVPDR
jgi:hypothetical protein